MPGWIIRSWYVKLFILCLNFNGCHLHVSSSTSISSWSIMASSIITTDPPTLFHCRPHGLCDIIYSLVRCVHVIKIYLRAWYICLYALFSLSYFLTWLFCQATIYFHFFSQVFLRWGLVSFSLLTLQFYHCVTLAKFLVPLIVRYLNSLFGVQQLIFFIVELSPWHLFFRFDFLCFVFCKSFALCVRSS